MSNTTMDVLYPEVWATEIDKLDVGDYPLPALVSNRNELGAGKIGEIVNVPLSADLGEADDYDPNSAPTATAIVQEVAQVTLNTPISKTIAINRTELTHSAIDIVRSYAPGMIRSLLRRASLEVYKQALTSEYVVDARTTFDENSIVSAYKRLDINEVPSEGRVLVAGPESYAEMLKFAAFTHADISGDKDAMRTGKIMERYGFKISKDHRIMKYTPTDVTGAINNGPGYTSSDFTIAVNGFNDYVSAASNQVRVGDLFTVASESGSPIHSVVSTTQTSNDTTGITFRTIINDSGFANAAKTDTSVVTVAPTSSILAMAPNGIAFASKPFASFPAGSGVRQMDMAIGSGLTATMSIWQQGLIMYVHMDLLVGAKMVKRQRVVRIAVD